MRQILLLRAINVGRRNRVAMPALRELLADAGLKDVSTYLQSGNVIVSSAAAPERLARKCERQIKDALGLEIAVIVRTRDQLAAVVKRNPLGKLAEDPKLYQVSFCDGEPDAAAVRKLAERALGGERLLVHGREVYGWFPDGVGRSRLAAQLGKQGLGVSATARNWSTVTKLLELADG